MKKVWIASIFACIMLMVPITNVVGVNEVDEDSVRASPLFNVRSKRVIDEESRDLAYDYIGKDEDSNLYFSNFPPILDLHLWKLSLLYLFYHQYTYKLYYTVQKESEQSLEVQVWFFPNLQAQ